MAIFLPRNPSYFGRKASIPEIQLGERLQLNRPYFSSDDLCAGRHGPGGYGLQKAVIVIGENSKFHFLFKKHKNRGLQKWI